MVDRHQSDTNPSFELFSGLEFTVELQPGFPAVNESYRTLRDQKDMLCGPYTLTYILRACGFDSVNQIPVTADSVAAAAGTVLEDQNAERLNAIQERIEAETVPEERASTWAPHDYYDYQLAVADEGGCSPAGLVEACDSVTGGELAAVPVPATSDGTEQLTASAFDAILSAALSGAVEMQLIFNYNLKETLAPVGIPGHKYNPIALMTQWEDPSYFRTLDWDVGHYTSLAGRVSQPDSNQQYVLIRDSYRSFGWHGYHLQPQEYVRKGVVRRDDHRDGGVLLITPSANVDELHALLDEHGLRIDTWDNGSPYRPKINPFEEHDATDRD